MHKMHKMHIIVTAIFSYCNSKDMKSQPLEAPQSRIIQASDVPDLNQEQWRSLYETYAKFRDGEDLLVFDFLSAANQAQSGNGTAFILFVVQWAGFILVQQKLAGEDDEFTLQDAPALSAWQKTLEGLTEISNTLKEYERNPIAMQVELWNPKSTLNEGAKQLIMLLKSMTQA